MRETMTPEGSGAPMRPGVDCPQCGEKLVIIANAKLCTCGHEERR